MALDEQRAATLAGQRLHHLPGVLRVLLRIGADERNGLVTQVAGGPDGAVLRMVEVGATARVRDLAHVDQLGQLALFEVHRRDLVAVVGRHHEVALGRVQAAVVQEARGADGRDLQRVDVGVVHQQGLAGFLDVHHELGLEVAAHDGGHARLGVVLLLVHGVAAGGDDLQRLQRVAVHDDELRRPVGAGNGVLVFKALVLAGLDRTRFQAGADLGHVVGLLHPQVDHVDLGVAADHEQVATRGRQARDVHRVAGLDDVDDLLGVAVDQRHFTRVTQRGREDVADVVVVHLLLRPLLRRHDDLPGRLHVVKAVLRRRRRVVLDVARHQVHFLLGHFAAGLPVGHAGRRAVGDEDLQVVGALGLGDVRGQRFAGGALAQHAMAAGAALEIDLAGQIEFGLGQGRRLGVGRLVHRLTGQWRRSGLVIGLRLGDALLVLGQAGASHQHRGHGQRRQDDLSGLHGFSLRSDQL